MESLSQASHEASRARTLHCVVTSSIACLLVRREAVQQFTFYFCHPRHCLPLSNTHRCSRINSATATATTMPPKRTRAASVKKTNAPSTSSSPEPKRSPEPRPRRTTTKEPEQEHGYEFFGPYETPPNCLKGNFTKDQTVPAPSASPSVCPSSATSSPSPATMSPAVQHPRYSPSARPSRRRRSPA